MLSGERHLPEHQRHRPMSLAGNCHWLCPAVLGIFKFGNYNLCIQRVFSWMWNVSKTTQDALEKPGIHSSSSGRSLPCIFLADKLLVSYPNGHPLSQKDKEPSVLTKPHPRLSLLTKHHRSQQLLQQANPGMSWKQPLGQGEKQIHYKRNQRNGGRSTRETRQESKRGWGLSRKSTGQVWWGCGSVPSTAKKWTNT